MKHIDRIDEFCKSEEIATEKLRSILSQEFFENILQDEIERQTKDFSVYNLHKVAGNPLSGNIGKANSLLEGLTKSFPLVTVKRHIKKKYEPSVWFKALPEHIKELLGENKWMWKIASAPTNASNSVVSFYDLEGWQFRIVTNPDGTQTHAIVIVPNLNENVLLMDKSMLCFGYYRACNVDVGALFPDVKNMPSWVVLQYEQRVQEFVNNKIRKETFLYHVSPTSVEHKILKQGLVPKYKNDQFNYPDRVYLVVNGFSKIEEGLEDVAEMLYKSKQNKTHNKYVRDNEYTAYRITVAKLPKSTNFYLDYNLLPLSVFTADNIPPTAIEVICRYTLEKE